MRPVSRCSWASLQTRSMDRKSNTGGNILTRIIAWSDYFYSRAAQKDRCVQVLWHTVRAVKFVHSTIPNKRTQTHIIITTLWHETVRQCLLFNCLPLQIWNRNTTFTLTGLVVRVSKQRADWQVASGLGRGRMVFAVGFWRQEEPVLLRKIGRMTKILKVPRVGLFSWKGPPAGSTKNWTQAQENSSILPPFLLHSQGLHISTK